MDQALRALFRPRHLLVTLLIALATGALGVTAAVVGEAPTPQAGSAWDLPFAVPPIREGDHGRYVHAGGNDGRTDGYWPDFVDFAWIGPGSAYDESGAQVLVNLLAYHEGREGWQPEVHQVLPGTGTELVGSYDSNTTYTDSRDGLWPGGNDSSVDRIRHVSFTGYTRPLSLWCGIVNPLQGLTVDLSRPMPDRTDCWNGPNGSTDDYRVVASEVGGPDGQRVAVFEGHSGDPGLFDSTFLRSYYREGVSYPVRLEFVSGDVGGDCECSAIYTLDGLTTGTTPLPSAPQVFVPPPPRAQLAARTETGPDEAGVTHPFPLSLAWTHARDDAAYTELASFRVDHPDAYVGQAMYEVHTQDARRVHRWYIVLSDGQAQFAFLVERNDATAPTLPDGPDLSALPSVASPTYRYERLTNGWEDGLYPAPDALPTEMPTVASMMAGWSAFSGNTARANSWTFDLRGAHDADGVYVAMQRYSAGLKSDDFAGVSTVASHRSISEDSLEYGADGRATGAFTRETTMDTTVDALPDAAPTPEAGDDEAALAVLEATPGISPGWEIEPREAAAVGGAALLVALAYFLWPLAKGGGLGLFSRVAKDKLLDNPLRQQLVQRIEAEPGVHHNALVRDLAKGKGAAEHHLEKLVAARLVLRHRGTGYTCYFPVGTDHRLMAAGAATKADGARKILEAMANGVTGVRGLAIVTDLAPSTVSHHLERLRAAGLVIGDGKMGYHLASPTGSSTPAAA